jgi:outer membrane receptor for ferrienterochelin and colicin
VRTPQDRALFTTPTINDVNYFDLSFGFDVTDNFTMNVGVNNLFDKRPQILVARRSRRTPSLERTTCLAATSSSRPGCSSNQKSRDIWGAANFGSPLFFCFNR